MCMQQLDRFGIFQYASNMSNCISQDEDCEQFKSLGAVSCYGFLMKRGLRSYSHPDYCVIAKRVIA